MLTYECARRAILICVQTNKAAEMAQSLLVMAWSKADAVQFLQKSHEKTSPTCHNCITALHEWSNCLLNRPVLLGLARLQTASNHLRSHLRPIKHTTRAAFSAPLCCLPRVRCERSRRNQWPKHGCTNVDKVDVGQEGENVSQMWRTDFSLRSRPRPRLNGISEYLSTSPGCVAQSKHSKYLIWMRRTNK